MPLLLSWLCFPLVTLIYVIFVAKFLMAFCLIWLHESGGVLFPLQCCRGELGKIFAPVAQSCSWHWVENGFLYRFFLWLLFFKIAKLKSLDSSKAQWDLAWGRGAALVRGNGWANACGVWGSQWIRHRSSARGKASLMCCWESSHTGVNT